MIQVDISVKVQTLISEILELGTFSNLGFVRDSSLCFHLPLEKVDECVQRVLEARDTNLRKETKWYKVATDFTNALSDKAATLERQETERKLTASPSPLSPETLEAEAFDQKWKAKRDEFLRKVFLGESSPEPVWEDAKEHPFLETTDEIYHKEMLGCVPDSALSLEDEKGYFRHKMTQALLPNANGDCLPSGTLRLGEIRPYRFDAEKHLNKIARISIDRGRTNGRDGKVVGSVSAFMKKLRES